LYTLINVLGLVLGITAVLVIGLYVADELSFDRFHSKSDQIVRVVEHKQSAEQGDQRIAGVAYNLASEALKNFAGVEQGIRFTSLGRIMLINEENQQSFYQEMHMAEPGFWQVFDFGLQYGDPQTALSAPNTVVLSDDLARRLYGDQNPVGELLKTDRGIEVQVAGVMQPIPRNSHFQTEALFSFNTMEPFSFYEASVLNDWQSNFYVTYLLLNPKADREELAAKISAVMQQKNSADPAYNSAFTLQALTDIHFGSAGIQNDQNAGKSSKAYVYIFSLVGLFILFLACINYMNLATARAGAYGKEVGVRKVVGANRRSLMGRFFAESLVISLTAFIIALNIVRLLLPYFNAYTGKSVSLQVTEQSYLLPLLLGIIIVVSLLAGLYPSAYLSRFNPVRVIKGKAAPANGHLHLRRSLVVFQFAISTIMILGTLVAFQQMRYISHKDLGFNQEQLVVVDINSGRVRAGYETIKNGYESLPDVSQVTVSSRVPGEWKVIPEIAVKPIDQPNAEGLDAYFIGGDADFLETFEVELLAGRNFDPNRLADSSAVILNERAAGLLGIEEPAGQVLSIPTVSWDGSTQPVRRPYQARVVGIVRDFHFQSLHEPLRPLVIGAWNNPIHSIDYFTARISPGNVESTIAQMTDVLHGVDPGHLFEYHFLDDQLSLFYEADQRRGRIFSVAALLAIVIACLGLFGLAAFTAEQRTKEIGIRKVLGASVSNIVALLSSDFLKLVGIALVIGLPIAWYLLNKWLQTFAYSVRLEWWLFVLTALLALLIAFFTIGFQSVKAAVRNPVTALRYE
jgi:putative ABC transport system permease protein